MVLMRRAESTYVSVQPALCQGPWEGPEQARRKQQEPLYHDGRQTPSLWASQVLRDEKNSSMWDHVALRKISLSIYVEGKKKEWCQVETWQARGGSSRAPGLRSCWEQSQGRVYFKEGVVFCGTAPPLDVHNWNSYLELRDSETPPPPTCKHHTHRVY